MKNKIFILILFVSSITFAQLNFEVKDIEQKYNGYDSYSFNIIIFVQNLGANTQINSLLNELVSEWKFRGISSSYYEEIADFFIIYKNPFSGIISSKIFPASITIKTIFGNYIPMDSPEYLFPSTGANSGQEWNILYTNIPKGAFDIYTKILGDVRQLPDLPGAEEVKKKIAQKNKALLEEAELSFKNGKYIESIEKFKSLFFADPTTKDKYSVKVAEAYYNLGKNSFENKKYETALEYFSDSFEYSNTFKNDASPMISKSYLIMGDKEFDNSEYEEASIAYKNAMLYDKTVIPFLSDKFNMIKKPAMLYGFYSIIPGLGQMINGKTTEGIIHFGIFSIASFLGYNRLSDGNKTYNDYKLASNSYLAETLYKEADDKRKSSYIYFGVAALTIIYSMFDSYTDIIQFNNLFSVQSSNDYASFPNSPNTIFSFRISL